ncbi:MAG: hypothetical protein DUD32_10110 [Lactobacillus sp.]|nr:MAG: hypothetical protein DUD32_10110 [Lactobacillus sp.]
MSGTMEKNFTHNWRNDVEIDTSGSLDPTNIANAKFSSLAAFITGITHTPGDVIDNAIYFADKDENSPEVTGHARTWAVTGNVLQGDPACDYLQGLEDKDATGNDAKTLVRITKANGTVRIFLATLENIITIGGNGNTKSTMTFTIAQNGAAVFSKVGDNPDPKQ